MAKWEAAKGVTVNFRRMRDSSAYDGVLEALTADAAGGHAGRRTRPGEGRQVHLLAIEHDLPGQLPIANDPVL